ncbi:MAG: hypothetical protein ACBR23_00725 [Microcoleus sp.]
MLIKLSHDDPIVLYRGTHPYELCDGRHRVYLANQRGIKLVPAAFN